MLIGIDLATGKRLWDKNLGTIQKGSPVLADGKLYVGTENGKFYILKPSKTGVEVLDEDVLPATQQEGTGGGRRAGADRRVAGRRQRPGLRRIDGRALRHWPEGAPSRAAAAPAATTAAPAPAPAGRRPPRVTPADVNLKPGQAQKFRVDLFDANGVKAAAAGARDPGRSRG